MIILCTLNLAKILTNLPDAFISKLPAVSLPLLQDSLWNVLQCSLEQTAMQLPTTPVWSELHYFQYTQRAENLNVTPCKLLVIAKEVDAGFKALEIGRASHVMDECYFVCSRAAPSSTPRNRQSQPGESILEANLLCRSNSILKLALVVYVVYEISFPFVDLRDDIVEESEEVLLFTCSWQLLWP